MSWYVASGSRKSVEAADLWLGEDALSPTIVSTRRRSRHTKSRIATHVPIWPGYLFVRDMPQERWDYIEARWEVRRLLSPIDRTPMTVSDDELRSCLTTQHSSSVLGRTVTIRRGPLSGWSGEVRRTVGSHLEVHIPAYLHPALVREDEVTFY